jgi:hypothetical protein
MLGRQHQITEVNVAVGDPPPEKPLRAQIVQEVGQARKFTIALLAE